MPFVNEPIMVIHGKDEWMLKNNLIYYHGAQKIEIPAGFIHDLASVPRVLNIFFRKHGDHSRAAIVHDYLYEQKGRVSPTKRYNREASDEIFYKAMLETGVPKFKAGLMWAGVRAGGFLAWKN